ncbi:long-chain-fatty-acid--CoA ligase [Marinobacter xestospongiae]|uniref:Long-chain-fatty-acid--CoA ligase n=1 Tax=Marinobacter xestospongiae TaxID=994319 RepID=A0ABU3W0N9_9GAMM|nr:long-chain-fatty-acid--CoA ligase [Marinobacter xestospongiae]MDV2079910.1 long-chain-fatty-acid--CoA ligase [Marinobacter xestospongiae]
MYCTQPIRRSTLVSKDKIATIDGDRQHTFGELQERISRFAGALQKLGVDQDDRVAVLALNSDRYYECFFAIPWAGAILVPLNIRWSVDENVYSLNDSGSSVLIVDDAYLSLAKEIQSKAHELKHCIYIGDGETPSGMLSYEELVTEANPIEDAGRGNDDLLGIFYTGGTTGFPKGVMISHGNFYSSALAGLASFDLNQSDVRYLHSAPMFHMADATLSMAATIAGHTHVFIPTFQPQAVLNAIKTHRVTDVALVPTMISMMLEQGAFSGSDVGSLRKIIYGASPMPEGTMRQVLDILPQVSFYQSYGQTELAPLITVLGPKYHVFDGQNSGKLRSAGQPLPIVDIKIVDAEVGTLPTGEVGEVWVKGPNSMRGYWNQPHQTETALIDGWVRTGDAGYFDEQGFLFLVDRVKDMIVSGGENVFSAEVESALSHHPAVQEVVVIGIPSDRWGESVHAVVRLQPGKSATEDELIASCRDRIAGYKCPRSIEFREEPFPMTGAGKLRKIDIRKPYWEGADRAIN